MSSGGGPGSFDQGYRAHLLHDVYGVQPPAPTSADHAVPLLSPLPPNTSKTVDTPAWRKRVGDTFVKRRQTPAAKVQAKHLQESTAAVSSIKFPPLPGRPNYAQRSDKGDGLEPRPPTQDRSFRFTPRKAGFVAGSPLKYTIDQPNPEMLYRPAKGELDLLPLELFDNDEDDLSPEEWLARHTTYEGAPARCLYYTNNSWQWYALCAKGVEERVATTHRQQQRWQP